VPSWPYSKPLDEPRERGFHRLVHLRAANPSDVGFLTDVVISATRDQGRLPDDFDEPAFRAAFESRSLQQLVDPAEPSRTYVIEVDGERAGRARVVRSAEVLELAGLQLLPGFQSRGVGSEILVLLKAEAAAADARLELSVEFDNPRARAFYERHGLVAIGMTDRENRLRWEAAD
jgi:GNAT superfamily N-acetyltransferase